MSHEEAVRTFYDSAAHCYESIMGHTWHHGDPSAEAKGLSVLESCQLLEQEIVKLAQLTPGKRALDFGSGVGGPTTYMAKVSGAAFTGVSNNALLTQRASALASELAVPQATFLTIADEDYKQFPQFPEASLDAVTFYESVCHLPDKAAFFKAAYRILKPGGRLVGIDWLQRPFGENVSEAQIMKFMTPVNELICIPWHGTVESYEALIEQAGFTVTISRDMFEGQECWGSTPDTERPQWLGYEGPDEERFRKGKEALDAARGAGVFTVGMFAATKPG
ncbi:MAG: methyltransferase domain-containing protein [Pseudomonadota bacterium]